MLETRFLKLIALLVCVLGMAATGCGGRQVLNVSSPVVTSKGSVSEEEVRQAILRAGAVTNWVMTPDGSNMLLATRTLGSHSATVGIGYTTDHYGITLRETTMIEQPTSGGLASPPGGARPSSSSPTVHRTYNRWVQELDQQIRGQLRLIGL